MLIIPGYHKQSKPVLSHQAWNPECQRLYEDRIKEERLRDERIRKMQEEMQKGAEERKGREDERKARVEEIDELVKGITENITKRQVFKERIRISHDGKDDPFIDAILDYLDELEDDNRRIEACYNIIKTCKGIAVDLQRGQNNSRRMFAKTIIDSDAFLDMPQSTQLLYFQLSMRADDDGFVNNPKSIMRNVGCKEDDMRVLSGKKFIIPFESGVIVIKHWKIHNYIQKRPIS